MELLIFIINSDYFCGNYKQITDDTLCCVLINPTQNSYTIIDNKNNIIEHSSIKNISTSLKDLSNSLISSKYLIYYAIHNSMDVKLLTKLPETTILALDNILNNNQYITIASMQNQLQTTRQDAKVLIHMLMDDNKVIKYYSYWKSLMYTNDKKKRE